MAVERRISSGGKWQRVRGLIERANALVRATAPPSLTQLALRFGLAVPFWRSGVNKWDGFLQLNDVAVLLFSTEFQLHLPGGPYAFPAPGVMAFATGSAEILLPILLMLGLATRLAALGLLLMTLVVQLTVPDGWPLHVTWAAMALGIMAWGAGRMSLDHWVKRRSGRNPLRVTGGSDTQT
jgi:putative oxidoreductase